MKPLSILLLNKDIDTIPLFSLSRFIFFYFKALKGFKINHHQADLKYLCPSKQESGILIPGFKQPQLVPTSLLYNRLAQPQMHP